MERSYKFRLYPNKKQEKLINHNFNNCRFVYNYFLAKNQEYYKKTGKYISFFQQCKNLTSLKEEFVWLYNTDASSLQTAIKNLDTAYKNFFRGVKKKENIGLPKFKSKKDKQQSFTTKCINKNIKLFDKSIQLPKIGEIKCKISKKVNGRILSATVSKNSSGKYFISICCTDVQIKEFPNTGKYIGIDMGVKFFVVTSDGVKYLNPKYLINKQKKYKKMYKQLSRKTRGSNRREKQWIKISKFNNHIKNQRLDMFHKLSIDLIRKYDIICIENLSAKNMIRNNNYFRYILDASFYEFRRQLEYKSKWYGKKVIIIDKFYPSSQLCSSCGYKNSKLKNLSIREWQCPNCKTKHDRDINAAKNILNEGLHLLVQ